MRFSRLPKRVPAGTKYVLESRGPWIHRYIEWPDGRRLELDPRKAVSCGCLAKRNLETTRHKAASVAA